VPEIINQRSSLTEHWLSDLLIEANYLIRTTLNRSPEKLSDRAGLMFSSSDACAGQ
jgi:hypothetical protein